MEHKKTISSHHGNQMTAHQDKNANCCKDCPPFPINKVLELCGLNYENAFRNRRNQIGKDSDEHLCVKMIESASSF